MFDSSFLKLESVESIFNQAICKYGVVNQVLKFGEELNELSTEIYKLMQAKLMHKTCIIENLMIEDRFINEFADVIITMKQIEIIMVDNPEFKRKVENMIKYKINRLADKIYKE